MPKYPRQNINPDRYEPDYSTEYREDYYVIKESICDCGCKTAIYVNDVFGETQIINQKQWEKLPKRTEPTQKQKDLEDEIKTKEQEEEKLGISHARDVKMFGINIRETKVPKLDFQLG